MNENDIHQAGCEMGKCMAINMVMGVCVALTTGCASRWLYYPDHVVYQTPRRQGLSYEEVAFTSRDGTALTGWFVPAKGTALGTIIHFHGNAQNMTAHFSLVSWLPAEGFNVFVFDYRGYGRSAGKPTRQGVFEDCAAAIEYVRGRTDVDSQALLVLGQSLGGAYALAVLGSRRFDGIKAVAIDSAFYSYRSIARDTINKIPLLWWARWPLSFLVISNRQSPGAVVQNIAPTPLILFHGTADQVVPYHHAQALFEKAREPKRLYTIEGGQHMDAFIKPDAPGRRELVDFFKRALRDDWSAGAS